MTLLPFGPTASAPVVAVQPTGVASGVPDTANLIAAINALPSVGAGVVRLAPGTWNVTCGQIVINKTGVYIDAPGCYIKAVGAGDLIRMYDSSPYNPRIPKGGGGVTGMPTLDGINTTGNSAGVHAGDINQLQMFVQAVNWTAGTTSKGLWFDNQYFQAEQMNLRCFTQTCRTGVMFDNSTGTSLSASANGSFDRATANIFGQSTGVGDLVTLNNGALIADGNVGIYGNMSTSATAYNALLLTGSNALNSSQIIESVLNMGVELDDVVSTRPMTIRFGAGANFLKATGVLDFSQGQVFTASNQSGNFIWVGYGPTFGDANLPSASTPFTQTITANAQTIFSTFLYTNILSGAAAFTGLILSPGTANSPPLNLVNKGTGTLTFDVPATSHVAQGTSVVLAVNGSRTFNWDTVSALWY